MKIRSLLVTLALLIAIAIIVLQRSQIAKLTADAQASHPLTDAAPETVVSTNPAVAASSTDSAELLRLRAEVAALRKQTNELKTMRAENAKMREALATATKSAASNPEQPPSDPERAQAMARLSDSKIYGLALILHFEDNKRFATNTEELAPYLGGKNNPLTNTNEFDIMLQGDKSGITNSSGTILVREHQPRQRTDGRWTRAYGFLDGHSEIRTEPTSNFDDYERQHMWPPQ
jgi:hypothetical protein